MNPLSAIRQIIPGLENLPSSGTGSIPAIELERLGAAGEIAKSSNARPQSFSSTLSEFVNDVNAKQAAAGQAVHDLQSGKNASLHQTMIALEEASVSFQLMV